MNSGAKVGYLVVRIPTRIEKHSTDRVMSVMGPRLGMRRGRWQHLELSSSEYRHASGMSSSISMYSRSSIFLYSFAGRGGEWENEIGVGLGRGAGSDTPWNNGAVVDARAPVAAAGVREQSGMVWEIAVMAELLGLNVSTGSNDEWGKPSEKPEGKNGRGGLWQVG